ncbi:ACT domain-containing protein [Caminicella sporogenes]|nr:ACT domain-containing protein [Caminicella sporogenes]WIF96225.1 ACT domain-containing protein [Caminicella sporogenes]
MLYARVDAGLEVLTRVVGVLKRKRFNVTSVKMEQIENSNFADLTITLQDCFNIDINRAISQLEKLVDVYEVKELEVM